MSSGVQGSIKVQQTEKAHPQLMKTGFNVGRKSPLGYLTQVNQNTMINLNNNNLVNH